ncbi:MAG: CAP domain-containing protein [Maribacter sp.]
MKMRMRNAFLFLFVCILGSCSKESLDIANIVEAKNAPEVENELLNTVNSHRVALGYSSLNFSAVAYEYANKHTDYMISKGGLSHDNFSSRAANIALEVEAELVAENVAKDHPTAAEAFNGWLNSSDHKKTMEGDFTHTAVSVKKSASGNYYYTQLFFKK